LAKAAALRMALLVAVKAVGSAWLMELPAVLLAEVLAEVAGGAVGFCSLQAVRMLTMANSRTACRHVWTVDCGYFT
jgi:hypothetical protein